MQEPRPTLPPLVVIGASNGGVGALRRIVQDLPADFPAAVAVTLHVGTQPSILPELLTRWGALPAVHAIDGAPVRPGVIQVAPPDRHLLLEPQQVRLGRGPRENHARPAVDPMFRTAALHWRERAIGVVLTGELDDGAAGLAAIAQCGGAAVVEDPAGARSPSMPASALQAVPGAHCLPLAHIGQLLVQLASRIGPQAATRPIPPPGIGQEQDVHEGRDPLATLAQLGSRSELSCPECSGNLTEVAGPPLRFRCHTGHAYSALALAAAQQEAGDASLWQALRALHERAMLLLRLATVSEATGRAAEAEAGRAHARRLRQQAEQVRRLIGEDHP